MPPTADSFTFVDTIHRTWQYIDEWFKTSDYIRLKGYEFERYCEKSRSYSEEILIPVEKAPTCLKINGELKM